MVSKFFANHNTAFSQAVEGKILITPNERLAKEHRYAYDYQQKALGNQAWVPLAAQSLSQFFLNQFRLAQDQLLETITTPKELLDTSTLHKLAFEVWQDPASSADGTLDLDTGEFVNALLTAKDFEIDLAHQTSPQIHWPYQTQLNTLAQAASTGLCSSGEIAEWLITHNCYPESGLFLDNLEQLTPAQLRYFKFVDQQAPIKYRACPAFNQHPHIGQRFADPEKHSKEYRAKSPETKIMAFADPQQELQNAFNWAYQKKQAQRDATIGIVVPNLNQNYQQVLRIAGEILDPAQGSLSQSFDIGSGVNLAQSPMWMNAEKWLQLCLGQLSKKHLLQMQNSPFLNLNIPSQIWNNWPRGLGEMFTLDNIRQHINLNTFEEAAKTQSTWQPNTTLESWINRFQQLLECIAWPVTPSLNSVQFQLSEALLAAINKFKQESTPTQKHPNHNCTWSQALKQLQHFLSLQVFAPQREGADILIVGRLETVGLSFDYLWVCGIDEESFPGSASRNRYLPQNLLQAHNVPGSTLAQVQQLAQRQLQHWSDHSLSTVFSFCHTREESEILVSPLLHSVLGLNIEDIEIVPPLQEHGNIQSAEMEHFIDDFGCELEISATTPGGISLLADQANCPFRAYAIHRLKLRRPQEINALPDALTRGIVIHDVLHKIVNQHPDNKSLAQVRREDIEQICRECLKDPLAHMHQSFVNHEIDRITQLVEAWLSLECQRAPFQALHLEKTYLLEFNQLTLRVRIDRIDETERGLIVIDYKTGNVRLGHEDTLASQQPQLPSYALLEDNVNGVYYNTLNDRGIAYRGYTEEDSLGLPKSSAKMTIPAKEWSTIKKDWQQQLETLATDFVSGRALVEPQKGACDYCHLKSMCRVSL